MAMEPRRDADGLDFSTYDWFVDRVNIAAKWQRDFKDEAYRYFQMYAGQQWEDEIKRELVARDRLPVVFNQVLSVINSVCGTEIMSRFLAKFLPRTVDDQGFSDILNGALRYMRDQTDAESEESQAFMDTLIAGVGAVEFFQDYSDGPEGRTKVERVPTFRLFWDPQSIKPNMRDAEWVAAYKYMTKDEAKEQWPEYETEIETYVTSFPELDADVSWHSRTRIAGLPWYDIDKDLVLVFDYQYRRMEPYYLAVDPQTGTREEYTIEEWRNIRTRIREINEGLPEEEQSPQPRGVRMSKYKYFRAHYLGSLELDDEELPVQNGFTLKFITCFRSQLEDRVEWFGLMKVMWDAQIYANKALSQILYMLSTNPKGAILAEENTFKDASTAMDNWAKPNAVIEVREGALVEGAIQIVKGEYPQDFERLYQLTSEAVIRVVGFSPYQVGQGGDLQRTAAQSLRIVQQNSENILSIPFDSLKSFRKDGGRTYLEYMREFMLPGTMMRVTTPGAQDQVVPFDLDWVEKIEYDIVIDEVPATPTQQQELWESLNVTQSLQLLMDAGVITPDLVVEMMPGLPEAIRAKMRENLAEQDAFGQAVEALSAGDPQAALQIIAEVAMEQGALPEAAAPLESEGPPS